MNSIAAQNRKTLINRLDYNRKNRLKHQDKSITISTDHLQSLDDHL